MKHDRARLGRWTREAIIALQSKSFWIRLTIGHTSGAPCGHLQAWIHPTTQQADSQQPKIVEMVCHKVAIFMSEWEALLHPDAVNSEWAELMCLLSELPAAEQAQWIGSAVLHVAEMATDFCRRFLFPCRTFPILLMWLIYTLPDQSCHLRQACAADLLRRSDSEINCQSAKKFVLRPSRHRFTFCCATD